MQPAASFMPDRDNRKRQRTNQLDHQHQGNRPSGQRMGLHGFNSSPPSLYPRPLNVSRLNSAVRARSFLRKLEMCASITFEWCSHVKSYKCSSNSCFDTTVFGRCRRYSSTRYSVGDTATLLPSTRTVCSLRLTEIGPNSTVVCRIPLPRLTRARARAISSPRSNGLVT